MAEDAPKMNPNKILTRLPALPQMKMLKHMDFMTLLEAYLMSPNIQLYASEMKKKHPANVTVNEFRWLIQPPGFLVIHIHPENCPRILFRIDDIASNTSQRYINGKKVYMGRQGTAHKFVVKSGKSLEEKLQMYADLSISLMDFFIVKEFHLKSNSFFWGALFDLNKTFKSVTVENQTLSVDQVNKLFNDIEVDEFEWENIIISDAFAQIDIALNHRKIRFDNALFLSAESLVTMKAEELRICLPFIKVRLDYETVVLIKFSDFINAWASGGMENVKEVELEMPHKWNNEFFCLRDTIFAENGLNVINNDKFTAVIERGDGKTAELEYNGRNFFMKLR